MTVGFIGLGVMGFGMAVRLARSGVDVLAFDAVPDRIAALCAEVPARAATSISEIGRAADTVVTVLPATRHVEQVYLGESGGDGGLLAALRPGALTIDCSSISPASARRIAAAVQQAGGAHLDAGITLSSGPPTRPVTIEPGMSPAVAHARAGTLKLLVGGAPETLQRAAGVLDVISQEQVYCGPSGAGMTVKLASNMVLASTTMLLCEVFVWAAKNGVPPNLLLDIFKSGSADSRALRTHVENGALRRRFGPRPFPVNYMYKDFTEAFEAAAATATPMPINTVVLDLMQVARARGFGDQDYPAVIQVLELLAGCEPLVIADEVPT